MALVKTAVIKWRSADEKPDRNGWYLTSVRIPIEQDTKVILDRALYIDGTGFSIPDRWELQAWADVEPVVISDRKEVSA